MDELFQKRLPEDVVCYHIYLPPALLNSEHVGQTLEDYLAKCTAFVLKETSNYIWQNECFNLHIVSVENLPCLRGSTNFADSLDDEWFIVYLLQKLTQEFSGLIATVTDTDGQFLLIEAADYIPKWLSASTCANRVFIADGSVHILSKPDIPGQIPFSPVISPTLNQALCIISLFSSETLASAAVRNCISKKIAGFPQKVFDNTQLTNVYIPKGLVYILDQVPNFISNCVQSFYLRDPLDLRACRTFKFMLPDDRVWCQLRMTRHHYAQLMQQNFTPDKRSGYQKTYNLTSAEQKAIDLGMKLAHGCEIFLSHFKHSTDKTCDQKDVLDEKKFISFISSLKSMDYFGTELEGSKEYQRLLNHAKSFYWSNLEKSDGFGSASTSFVFKIHKLLQVIGQNKDDIILEQIPHLQNLIIKTAVSDLPSESSDAWMYLDEDDVNAIAEKINKGFSSLHNNTDDQAGKQLKNTVQKVNEFVNEKSDFSGIEVDDSQAVKFGTKDFLCSLEELLQISQSKNAGAENSASNEFSDEFLSSDEDNDFTTDSFALNETSEFREYFNCMDDELAKTAVGKSFINDHSKLSSSSCESSNIPSVDVDVNLLENFITGQNEEKMSSGPISNILNTIGADLPQ